MITPEIIDSIDQSVLCWLATVSGDGFPNVSPKEAFLYDGKGKILIGNIASPVTVRNIERDERVCVSFVNVFVQKGYKITGRAKVLRPDDVSYEDKHRKLTLAIGSAFPIISIIEIDPVKVDEIIAPSYRLFPDSGPAERIKEALATYRVDEYKRQAEPSDAGIIVSPRS
ncbi:MAG: pyridoxamine 5'-phosphate oxidase family protein [Verrucomicrobiae bacterium]|nr:pyridoxamine 5'-phosphate oxidase family protein [Verrucomicrobiae bacterium]